MSNFIKPKTLDDLVMALKNKDDKTYIVAGGTDLSVKINERCERDFKLIDISDIEDIKNVKEKNREILIGASVTMTELVESEIIDKNVKSLKEAAGNLGSTQIRNRATIGGNVCNAAQCADTIPCLFSYGAFCEIINSNGDIRRDLVENTITGIGKTTLKQDEAIIRFILPLSNDLSAFTKIGDRKGVTISKINCAMKICTSENIIKDINIYMGSIGVMPIRANLIESEMKGKNLNKDLFSKIIPSVRNQVEEAIPNRPSKYYKKQAALGLIEDAILKLIERSEQR